MKDILTEAEAKGRWCPLVRTGESTTSKGDEHISINRQMGGSPIGMCIASDCMAWRLAHKPASNGDETGYCGAFGTPRFT